MNIKQQSKLKMFLTVRVLLLSSSAITAKLPNFTEFMAALDAAILQIQTHSEAQHFDTKGVTDNKQSLRDSLVIKILDASAKMQAYAKYFHDSVLLSETKFTKTQLIHVSSLELLDIANGLYNRIDAHLADVAPYGLTAATQTNYRTAIDDYTESIPQTRQSQLKTKENTALEAQGFIAAYEAIDNIDSLVEIVRLTEPVFYANYVNARKIVDQGKGTLQVQGTVTEAATGKPIAGALLTFRLKGQTKVILEKESADKGGLNIKTLAEGIYDVTITKVGFKTQTNNIIVNWNELCVLNVAMERI
ncbi:MAG: carboxypeptidase-like regulatory domain-containing protein [Paludibacter sp.]|nr:carboxypeptidase-like regulatory domain-containing protein [Paludibacter sp.]